MIDGGATHDQAIDLLVDKYRQYRDARPVGPVLAIDIVQISSWEGGAD